MSHAGLEPDRLLELLHADLSVWVKQLKGTLTVAADPWNFLELLAESPTGWRAVLHWEGDSALQDHPLAGGFLRSRFSLGLTCQRGLSVAADSALFRKRADGAPALLRLVALARARVRSFVFPADCTDRYVLYKGADPLVLPDGMPLLGYRLSFELNTAPAPVTYRNE